MDKATIKPPSSYRVLMLFKDGKRMLAGNAETLEAAREVITTTEKNRRETFGGLLSSARSEFGKVRYATFKAEWTFIEETEGK